MSAEKQRELNSWPDVSKELVSALQAVVDTQGRFDSSYFFSFFSLLFCSLLISPLQPLLTDLPTSLASLLPSPTSSKPPIP